MKTELPFEIINGVKHYNFKKSWHYLEQIGKQKFGQKFKLNPEDKEIRSRQRDSTKWSSRLRKNLPHDFDETFHIS
jgi:hypothetical protein